MFTISLMSLNVIEVKALMNHKEDVKKIKVRIGAAEYLKRFTEVTLMRHVS